MSDEPMIWKDPPDRRLQGARGVDGEIVQQLRQHPGQWALVRVCANPKIASNQLQARKRGVIRAWRPVGDFELVSSGSDIYARYVGEVTS
jgi:hypothetical protein